MSADDDDQAEKQHELADPGMAETDHSVLEMPWPQLDSLTAKTQSDIRRASIEWHYHLNLSTQLNTSARITGGGPRGPDPLSSIAGPLSGCEKTGLEGA